MSIEKKKVNRGAGRRRGSELSWAKLDESDVALIKGLLIEREKHLYQAKMLTSEKIGDKFGVSGRVIDNIAAGRTWAHVKL